mmetsp:Transcript_15027/g.29023  ORF Transcript_15027/g.29023 Transcript_15027/m.29023 type:complete len:272 (-) Transcript_15027:15-830(-)
MGAAHGETGVDVFCGRSSASECCRRVGSGEAGLVQQPMAYPNVGSDSAVDGAASDSIFGFVSGLKETASEKAGGMVAATGGHGSGIHECQDSEEVYEDGSSYKGQLLEGRRHGNGDWKSSTETYSGQWKCDYRDGHGRQTWRDQQAHRIFEGQFKFGQFDGHGRMEWHSPGGVTVYDGQYMSDVKHGTGKYSWSDGRSYDGQWKAGKRSGTATFTNSAGVQRRGLWKDDKVDNWLVEEFDTGAGANPDTRWDEERRDLHSPLHSADSGVAA